MIEYMLPDVLVWHLVWHLMTDSFECVCIYYIGLAFVYIEQQLNHMRIESF